MNNKKMNKKGFTIVELVIVIAVIAILAGVMIPTFSGIIKTANESAEMQKVTAAYKEAYAIALSDDGNVTADDFDTTPEAANATVVYEGITVGAYTFEYTDSTWSVKEGTGTTGYTYSFADGKWTATKSDS